MMHHIDITFPDRYDYATTYADSKWGPIETAPIPDVNKLALYALRKQAEVGNCNESAPYMWNVKERYKHDAWKQLSGVSKFEAMVKYVEVLEDLVGRSWIEEVAAGKNSAAEPTANESNAAVVADDDLDALSDLTSSLDAGDRHSSGSTLPNPTAHSVSLASASGGGSTASPQEVSMLREEIRRLRSLLMVNGIDPDSGCKYHAQAGSSLSGPPPPISIHPGPFPNISPPPAPPTTGIAATLATVSWKPEVAELAEPEAVYYTSQEGKMGWLEWLGLVSANSKPELVVPRKASNTDSGPSTPSHPTHSSHQQPKFNAGVESRNGVGSTPPVPGPAPTEQPKSTDPNRSPSASRSPNLGNTVAPGPQRPGPVRSGNENGRTVTI
jgi:diazepam-binding inhibitor (GABA receptor modulating acyl-CoA-binding protein)